MSPSVRSESPLARAVCEHFQGLIFRKLNSLTNSEHNTGLTNIALNRVGSLIPLCNVQFGRRSVSGWPYAAGQNHGGAEGAQFRGITVSVENDR